MSEERDAGNNLAASTPLTDESADVPDEYGEDQRFPAAWETEALFQQHTSFDVIDLVIAFPDWVHRRKERAEIASPSRVQWHCSVDFTIPDLGRPATHWFPGEEGDRVLLVPLDVLSKKPLITFDCRDEAGSPVPVLTRNQNGIVAYAAMSHWAESITRIANTSLSAELRGEIRTITQGDEETALSLIDAIAGSPARDRQAVAADVGFMQMLQTLAQSFMLIAVLRGQPGDRRIIKLSYERQLKPPPLPWKEKLALAPTVIGLVVPMFRDCESYHFEAVAPEGTNFTSVRLVDNPSSGPLRVLEAKDLRATTPHVAHLSVSRSSLRQDPKKPDPDTFTEPVVELATQLDRTSWQRSALYVSLLIAAFMTATFLWILGWSDDPHDEWCTPEWAPVTGLCAPSPEAEAGTDPAALFVGVVGLLSFAVVRGGEHAYTARLVRPLRNLVWANALLPVAGAWLIVFPGPGSVLRWGWFGLVVAALVGVAILAIGYRQDGSRTTSQDPGTVR